MSPGRIVALGAAFGGAAVVLGAFGAHGLRARVTPEMLAIFETAVRYHFYHALALVLVGLFAARAVASPGGAGGSPLSSLTALCFTLGIVIFSGNAEGTMRQDLLTLGVRDYIVKPAPLPRIVDAVRRAIDPAPEAYPRESAL